MKNKHTTIYKWAYLPFVFSSAAILATQATAAPGASQQYQDARQVNSANYEYVGGRTQIGLGVTDDGDVSVDLNAVLSETENSSTSAGLWAGYDVKGDDKGIKGRGVQINHNWVSRDNSGRATRVNKVFAAYDRNEDGHDKATVGYGQENESLFWEGHVSKGLSGKKNSRVVGGKLVSDRAYDYGVGGSVGTFIKGSNIRVRAGLDHEWGDDVGAGESDAKNTTLSAGIEKFFQGTPHSLGLDVAASKRSGGYDNGSDDTDFTGKLSYRYDFGGASIYQPDKRYRRVRVEIPGRTVAPRYARKAQFKRVPTYKTVSTYAKKTVRTPYKQLVKTTMELEGQTFFKLNSAKLIPSAQTRLKQIAREIRKNGYKGSIRITGNTCGMGDPVYDQRLSEKRAKAVKSFLMKNGFNANRLIARGLGKGHPKYPRTPGQDFKNRRVDIEYVSEHKAFRTGYRTEQKTVRTGTRRVATGFKNVPAGFKNVLISGGRPGAPRVIWKTEVIPTSPAWIKRALHNNIKHNTAVNTYQTTASSAGNGFVNNGPVAVNDIKNASCNNEPVIVNVLENDSDADNDTLTVTNVGEASYGTVELIGNQVIYTPNGKDCGRSDSFEYTVSDGNGGTATAMVTINIGEMPQEADPDPVPETNEAPVAVNDFATTTPSHPVALTTLSNDRDPDGDTLSITSVQNPAHGTAVIRGGQILYTPDVGFVGTDRFTYTISDGNGGTATATETVVVKAIVQPNRAPTAVNDIKTVSCSTAPVVINVLSNDVDPDNDNLTIISTSGNASYGSIKFDEAKIIYTPNGQNCGVTDNFKYTISDGRGHTSTAVVKVKIGERANTKPDAVNDTRTTKMDQAITINVLGNDTDPENDTLTVTSFTQSAKGGTVTKGSDGKLVYTPATGFYGQDTFTYTISDGHGGTDTATVTITVTKPEPVNMPPVAVNDSTSTTCSAVTIKVLDNDTDPENDSLSLVLGSLSATNLGTAVISGNTIIYTPSSTCEKGNTGVEKFSYSISDGHGHTATANVTVNVNGMSGGGCKDTCIEAESDEAYTTEGQAVTATVLSNDVGDASMKVSFVDTPSNGSAAIVGNGSIRYTPNAGFTGVDSFWYKVTDKFGAEDTALLVVYVEDAGCSTVKKCN